MTWLINELDSGSKGLTIEPTYDTINYLNDHFILTYYNLTYLFFYILKNI